MRLIESRIRQLRGKRGLDWDEMDEMTDQEKEELVDNLLHDDRA
jgi:hypothetical protein